MRVRGCAHACPKDGAQGSGSGETCAGASTCVGQRGGGCGTWWGENQIRCLWNETCEMFFCCAGGGGCFYLFLHVTPMVFLGLRRGSGVITSRS